MTSSPFSIRPYCPTSSGLVVPDGEDLTSGFIAKRFRLDAASQSALMQAGLYLCSGPNLQLGDEAINQAMDL